MINGQIAVIAIYPFSYYMYKIFKRYKESAMSWINIADIIYLIGSYYISNNNTPPAELFGDTWTQLTGRFLYATTSTSTGGSNTHTLTVNEMPSHNHAAYIYYAGTGFNIDRLRLQYTDNGTSGWLSDNSGCITNTGGGGAHNNMPAYKGCYCWYRTA